MDSIRSTCPCKSTRVLSIPDIAIYLPCTNGDSLLQTELAPEVCSGWELFIATWHVLRIGIPRSETLTSISLHYNVSCPDGYSAAIVPVSVVNGLDSYLFIFRKRDDNKICFCCSKSNSPGPYQRWSVKQLDTHRVAFHSRTWPDSHWWNPLLK